MNHNSDYLILYVDGASRINKQIDASTPSAWAYHIEYKGKVYENSKAYYGKTNNSMEITAAIAGLMSVNDPAIPIKIYSDSAYLINCMNQGWYKKWEASNWERPSMLKNVPLWKTLLAQVRSHNFVQFFKVKGHSDDPLNNRVDFLCNTRMDELVAGVEYENGSDLR